MIDTNQLITTIKYILLVCCLFAVVVDLLLWVCVGGGVLIEILDLMACQSHRFTSGRFFFFFFFFVGGWGGVIILFCH